MAPRPRRRAATALARLPEPLAYALHPFLVHSRLDRLLLPPFGSEIEVEALDGERFALDPVDEIAREILHFGAYERRGVEILRALAGDRGGTLLDVGANLGNHTILLARRFDRVAAFEPSPTARARLLRNIALNALDHVQVHGVGLSDADADVPFRQATGSNPGASRILAADTPETTRVTVRPGDAVVDQHRLEPVRMIKIDVEGHEEQVIAGLARTIRRDRPVVAFEWESGRNGPGCLARLEGYRFLAQPWELTPRWWRPLARGLDAAGPPRLAPVSMPDLVGRYIGMVIAVPDSWTDLPFLRR